MAQPKTLTIRLKSELYDQVSQLARDRGRSLNAMISEALEAMLTHNLERELYEAATLLGGDPAMTDVEWSFQTQHDAIEAFE